MSAGHDIPLADLLIGRLRHRGLRRMFGVPGGGSSFDIIDAGRRAGVDFVLSRREDAGAIMAAVTAWLSGAPGLALATKGPGLTSAANGIASAYLDRSPVLFLSDGFGADEASYVSHQYFDQAGVLGPITKADSTLSGDDPCREIDDLLAIMNSHPRRGPGAAGAGPPPGHRRRLRGHGRGQHNSRAPFGRGAECARLGDIYGQGRDPGQP